MDDTETPAAFTVIQPDGQKFQVWQSGKVAGFAEGSIIINRIPVHACAVAVEFGQRTLASLLEPNEALDDALTEHAMYGPITQGLKPSLRALWDVGVRHAVAERLPAR